MKVLHVYKSHYPEYVGGIELFIFSLSHDLRQRGITSDVFTTSSSHAFSQQSVDEGVVYVYPRNANFFSCPISFSACRHLNRVAQYYDVIHYYFPWPFADVMHLWAGVKKPTILTYQSDIVRQAVLNVFYQPLMHRFFNKIDAIVTTSENLLNTSPVLARYRQKTSVIPIGINKSFYPVPTQANIDMWRHKVGDDFFLFMGVLRYYKGLTFLLEAVRGTNIPLVIAGAGPEEARLKKMAKNYQLNNVIFLGRVSEEDKVALLSLCRSVVAPSHLRSEAFCISLLEGLMFNKPLISTEIGTGTSFVNQHHLSGLVVPPANPKALREAMRLLMSDQALYSKLQKGTQIHYTAHFTGDIMAKSYSDLYAQVAR